MKVARNKTLPHPAGFTLIEAMIALAILAILVSLALPSIQSAYRTNLMASATQEVMHLVDFARVQAQSRNRAYELVADIAAGTITINESSNTKCTGFSTGVKDIRNLKLGVGDGEFKTIGMTSLTPNGFGTSYNLCFKPDGRVLRTDTSSPVPATAEAYGAGEARIVIQEIKSGQAVGIPHTIVIPYNGIPIFEPPQPATVSG